MDITALTFDERDEFKRKSIAEEVVSLLQADIDIPPMVIDGSWGTGKTEFCHKLINQMRDNETHHLIYINAFKADHADERLMTVLAEVIKILPDNESKQRFIKFLQHLPAQICHTPVTALKRESCAKIKSTPAIKHVSLLAT
jgi:predicted KAP-like P-loop ATPase